MLGAVVFVTIRCWPPSTPSTNWLKKWRRKPGNGLLEKDACVGGGIAALAEADVRQSLPGQAKDRRAMRKWMKSAAAWWLPLRATMPMRRASPYQESVPDLEAKIVRGQILDGEPRIDGRDNPYRAPDHHSYRRVARTHGSALFNP